MNGIDSSDDNEKMENEKLEICCLIDDGVKCSLKAGRNEGYHPGAKFQYRDLGSRDY